MTALGSVCVVLTHVYSDTCNWFLHICVCIILARVHAGVSDSGPGACGPFWSSPLLIYNLPLFPGGPWLLPSTTHFPISSTPAYMKSHFRIQNSCEKQLCRAECLRMVPLVLRLMVSTQNTAFWSCWAQLRFPFGDHVMYSHTSKMLQGQFETSTIKQMPQYGESNKSFDFPLAIL